MTSGRKCPFWLSFGGPLKENHLSRAIMWNVNLGQKAGLSALRQANRLKNIHINVAVTFHFRQNKVLTFCLCFTSANFEITAWERFCCIFWWRWVSSVENIPMEIVDSSGIIYSAALYWALILSFQMLCTSQVKFHSSTNLDKKSKLSGWIAHH